MVQVAATRQGAAVGVDYAHTGAQTPAGRYMRLFWQPVYHSVDLVAGKPVPLRIMNELFTLYRGESGRAYLVGAHCPHRRTLLATGRVERDELRCFYHGWKFGGDGRCVEQPAEEFEVLQQGVDSVLSGTRVPGADLRLPWRRRAAGISALSRVRELRRAGGDRLLFARMQLLPKRRECSGHEPRGLHSRRQSGGIQRHRPRPQPYRRGIGVGGDVHLHARRRRIAHPAAGHAQHLLHDGPAERSGGRLAGIPVLVGAHRR